LSVETVASAMSKARAEAGPEAMLVGVIGSPIAHSLSPLLHNAAFVALGLDRWRSSAFEVAEGAAAEALAGMESSGLTGLSVTMPHKEAVAQLIDDLSPVASRLGAVNCVVHREGVLYGANTDGQGFIQSLARGAGFSVAGRRCLVAGAGGAARAVVLALAEEGASEVAVMNRTQSRAELAATLGGAVGRVVALGDVDAAAQADLIVNATPLGMIGASDSVDEWLVSPALLHHGQVAADLVYAPRRTTWLAAAAEAGATVLGGLGMLVHQAAAQIELWTGVAPPVDAMWSAAEAAT
jgi:shikimate dehydrogenase